MTMENEYTLSLEFQRLIFSCYYYLLSSITRGRTAEGVRDGAPHLVNFWLHFYLLFFPFIILYVVDQGKRGGRVLGEEERKGSGFDDGYVFLHFESCGKGREARGQERSTGKGTDAPCWEKLAIQCWVPISLGRTLFL